MTHYTQEMKMKATDPLVKRVFVIEHRPEGLNDCLNCGGTGFLYLFLATEGPYQTPGAAYSKVSKWFDGAWWCAPSNDNNYGTVSFKCPDCHGLGYKTRT